MNGKKTYIIAGLLVLWSISNQIFNIPDDLYNTVQDVLNYGLYGTVGHKLLRTFKK